MTVKDAQRYSIFCQTITFLWGKSSYLCNALALRAGHEPLQRIWWLLPRQLCPVVRMVLLHHRHLRGVGGHSYVDSTTLWNVIKLKPLSQIATAVLFFVKYLPMTAIATTYITDMWHFCNMALDGSKSLFTHFGQFLRCNLRILSDSVFDPFIKNLFLGAILSATLGAILSNILSATNGWLARCRRISVRSMPCLSRNADT